MCGSMRERERERERERVGGWEREHEYYSEKSWLANFTNVREGKIAE